MEKYILNEHILFDFKGKFDIDYEGAIQETECTLNALLNDIFDSTYGKSSDENNLLNQTFGFYRDLTNQKIAINENRNNIRHAFLRGYETKTIKTIKGNKKESSYVYDYGIITQVKNHLGLDLYTYLQESRPYEEKLSCLRLLKILYAVEKYKPVSNDISKNALPYANKTFVSALRNPSLDYFLSPYADKIDTTNLDFLMHLVAEAYNKAYVNPVIAENVKTLDCSCHTDNKNKDLSHSNAKDKSNSSIIKAPNLTFENVQCMLKEWGLSPECAYDSDTPIKCEPSSESPNTYVNSSLSYHNIYNFWNNHVNALAQLIYDKELFDNVNFGVDLNSFNHYLDALQSLVSKTPSSKDCRNALEDFYWSLQYFYGKCFSESCLTIFETIKPCLEKIVFLEELPEEARIEQFQSFEILTFIYKDHILQDNLYNLVTATIDQNYIFNRLILNQMGAYGQKEIDILYKITGHLPDIYKSYHEHNTISVVPFSLGTVIALMEMIYLCQNNRIPYEAKSLYRKGHPRNVIDIITNIYKAEDSVQSWTGHLIIQLFTPLLYAKYRLSTEDFDQVLKLTEKLLQTQSMLGTFGPFGESFRLQQSYDLLDKYLAVKIPDEASAQFITMAKKHKL